jgi:hyperosmotically inducible periplasmic protein
MFAGRQTAASHDRIFGVYTRGGLMKHKLTTTIMIVGVLLGPVVAVSVAANEDSDADRSHPKAFVKDSAITTKVKSKLAAEHITSLGNIHVDTDADGVVWLHGTAHTQDAADKAVAIARETEGVKGVHSRIKVKKDD